MIRTLTIAAAAAAVGYALGQRGSQEPESRFERDRPTESGVGVRQEEMRQPPEFKADYENPYQDGDFDTDGEVIGQ